MWRRFPARHISERDLARSTLYNEVITSYGVLITMSRTDRELLRDVLEALVFSRINSPSLIEEIRARLAEPEPEPVAWSTVDGYVYRSYVVAKHSHGGKEPIPLYRHPRPVRLSDYEVSQLMNNSTGLATYKGYKLFADRIMDAMLEKNQ